MSDASAAANEHQGTITKKVPDKTFFEDSRFQALSIRAALGSLLVVLDECRYLLQSSHPVRPLSSTLNVPEYGRHISARERKILDEAIEQFRIELSAEEEKEFNRLAAKSANEPAQGSVYPFSTEVETVAMSMLFGEIANKVAEKHFSKFANDPISVEYLFAKVRLGPDGNREIILGNSLLPLIVSKAEEFLGALVRTGLSLYPAALGEPPSVPNEIIMQYQRNISSSDIRRWQVDRQVTEFLRNSPDEWRKLLERWVKIDIANLGADWDALNEMIQRRHAIIHNGGRADSEYLGKIAPGLRQGLHPGSLLTCKLTYIEPVMIELETWAICLALRFSKRIFKEKAEIYDGIIRRATRLQRLGRWTQALAIMDSYLLAPLPLKEEDVILAQINRWFCLQELGRDNESVQREIQSWRAGESVSRRDQRLPRNWTPGSAKRL